MLLTYGIKKIPFSFYYKMNKREMFFKLFGKKTEFLNFKRRDQWAATAVSAMQGEE